MDGMRILDVNKAHGKRIKLANYTHLLAYHACRAENEQIFRTQGLKPYTKDEALSAAIHKLECDRVSQKDIKTRFEELWGTQPKSVYLMLETTELLGTSCHYLIYGSEFINALAMHLGCRDRLKEIGKPMFLVCAVPISDIHKDRLSFERIDGFDYRYVKHDGVYYVPIHHPSYIHVYKRKQVDSYIHSIHNLAEALLNSET